MANHVFLLRTYPVPERPLRIRRNFLTARSVRNTGPASFVRHGKPPIPSKAFFPCMDTRARMMQDQHVFLPPIFFSRSRRRPGVSSNTRGSSSRSESGMWNYDKIATNQPMSEAFKTFANRALCQESVWFLEEVSRCAAACIPRQCPLEGSGSSARWGRLRGDGLLHPPHHPPRTHTLKHHGWYEARTIRCSCVASWRGTWSALLAFEKSLLRYTLAWQKRCHIIS